MSPIDTRALIELRGVSQRFRHLRLFTRSGLPLLR